MSNRELLRVAGNRLWAGASGHSAAAVTPCASWGPPGAGERCSVLWITLYMWHIGGIGRFWHRLICGAHKPAPFVSDVHWSPLNEALPAP
jgi:hypothetical protein